MVSQGERPGVVARFALGQPEETMTKKSEDESREALATFGQAARSKDKLPDGAVTPETEFKGGDLKAGQKDAADILDGNATGNKAKVDAAIQHTAKTDKRSGV